ncbi:hypothetical protein MVES_000744 [Malassezia vespertilionis]|uniref:Uncharacterized protein n=2 Tax=Malassezia vespertilionis TaxID=2020962 RepID=A0A2N1JER0_9BASI|nr:hypothetical protein MVES_000744 [Malassezia vespertilionis]
MGKLVAGKRTGDNGKELDIKQYLMFHLNNEGEFYLRKANNNNTNQMSKAYNCTINDKNKYGIGKDSPIYDGLTNLKIELNKGISPKVAQRSGYCITMAGTSKHGNLKVPENRVTVKPCTETPTGAGLLQAFHEFHWETRDAFEAVRANEADKSLSRFEVHFDDEGTAYLTQKSSQDNNARLYWVAQ